MYSLTKDRPKVERSNLEMPEIDLSKIELPKVELPKVDLLKMDLSRFEMPKVDVGKAVNDAATAAGLVRPHRPRWQYALGAGLIAAVGGWAYINQAMIRERLSQAKTWIGDQIGAMREERPEDAIAFRTVPTAPLDSGLPFDGDSAAQTDYPEGFGAPSEMAVTSNGDSPAFEEATSSRR